MINERAMVSWVEEYLSYRRKLGFQLKTEGSQLVAFAEYADKEGGNEHLNTELALRWARLPVNTTPLYWARRLEVVRCFARYLAVFDPLTEIPPKGIETRSASCSSSSVSSVLGSRPTSPWQISMPISLLSSLIIWRKSGAIARKRGMLAWQPSGHL